MSLLMDALRKAEADKKAAAARTAGAPAPHEDLTDGFARTADQLQLEPLAANTSENLNTARSHESLLAAGNTSQRLNQSGRFQPLADLTLADEVAFVRPPASAEAPPGGSLSRPELVTARTVFAATQRRRFRPFALGLGAALLLACGSLGWLGYRYYLQTPPPLVIPSPRVALGVEHGVPGAAAAPVATPLVPVIVLPPPDTGTALGAPADASSNVHADMAAVAAALDSMPGHALNPGPDLGPDLAPNPRPGAPPRQPAAPGAAAQDFEMRSGEMRIARSVHGADAAQRQLTKAYHAFESGDLVRAKDEYAAVLKALPQQRDALLGLGAIALAENRLQDAHRYYAAVLTGAPDHPLATAAMFIIEGGRGAHATEAKLKLLLDRDIEAPYLHFALGNWYAREQRWGDAQQAYFAAVHGQPRNADYVFNLAVSLDQLGQRKAALDYYRQAEALRSATTNFDGAAVAARIAALAAP